MDNNMSARGGYPARGGNGIYGGKNFDIKKVIEWLGYLLRCPICGIRYRVEQSKVIESAQDEIYGEASILIHSDCSKCKSSVMFNVEIRGPEVFSVGMVTDLTRADSSKFKIKKPISSNDVISIHKEIRSLKGSFIQLFTERQNQPN